MFSFHLRRCAFGWATMSSDGTKLKAEAHSAAVTICAISSAVWPDDEANGT